MSDFDARRTLKLSIQRALIDAVTDELYAVTCGIDESNCIHIVSYFDGPFSDEGWDAMSTAAGEVIADFPENFRLEEMHIDATQAQPVCLDFWAFRRKRKPINKNLN